VADEIQISLEASQVQNVADQAAKKIAGIVSQAAAAEKKVADLTGQLGELNTVMKGADNAAVLKSVQLLGQALSGAFSEAQLKIKAVQGQLLEMKAQALNITASILNAQASAARSIAKAVQEAQIQAFQRNPGASSANDAQTLRLRLAAAQRSADAAALSGKTAPAGSAENIATLKQQLAQVTAQRTRENQTLAQTLRLQEQLTKATQQYALARAAGDDSGRFRALTQIANTRASLQFARSGNTVDESSRAAFSRADDLNRSFAGFSARQRADQAAARQQQRAAQQPSLEEQASRSMQITNARFSLNGGADLFKLQTQILANYQVVNTVLTGIRNGFDFVVGFQAAMKELQAITGATDTELQKLSQRFIDVSTNSRFSGTEIAKAATIMGQAGLSAGQINESIDSVIKLATATGTDLKTAVDLVTSAMGIFNLRASEMGNVADMVSAALNVSKLDAQKMALGLQYAGNIAAESGVSFQELTTALAALSNAGIKSGSTLGTGLRQLIQDLLNPSTKLKDEISRLGLTMSDVDIKTQGLFGVLENLRDAGFSTSDALATMELRGAAAFSALTKNMDGLQEMQQQIALSGDAAKANATQMDSVEAQLKRVGSAFGGLAVSMTGPIMGALKQILGVGADFLNFLKDWSGLLSVLSTVLAGIATTSLLKWLGGLVAGLSGIKGIAAAMVDLMGVFRATESASITLSAAFSLLSKSNVVFLALSAAVTAALYAFDLFGQKNDDVARQMDVLQTAFNDSKGRFDNYQTTAKTVGDEIDKLAEKHSRLSDNSGELASVIAELNNRFKDTGFYVSDNVKSVDALISKLKELQQQQLVNSQGELRLQESQLQGIQATQAQSIGGFFGNRGVSGAVRNLHGFSFQSPTAEGIQLGPEQVEGPSGAGNDLIKRALGVIQNTNVDVNNPESVNGTIGSLISLAHEVTAKRVELISTVGDAASDTENNLQNLANRLNDAIKELQNYKSTGIKLKSNQQDQGKADFSAGSLGKAIRDFQVSALEQLSAVENQYTGKNNPGGQISDQMKRDHSTALANLYSNLSLQYKALITGADQSALKATGLDDSTQSILQNIRGRANTAGLDVNKLDELILDQTKKRIQAQIQAANAQVNAKTPIEDIEAIPDTLNDLYAQLRDTELRLAAIKRKQTAVRGESQSAVESDAEIRDRINTSLGKDTDKIHQFLDESDKKADEASIKIEQLPAALKKLGDRFKTINDGLKNADAAAQTLINVQNARVANAQSRLTGGAFRFSGVETTQLQQRGEGVQQQVDVIKLGAIISAIAQQTDLRASQTTLHNQYQSKIGSLTDSITNDGSLSDNDRSRLESERMNLSRQDLTLNGQMVATEEKLKELEQQRADLGAVYNARWGRANAQLTLGTGFVEALRQYLDETGRLKDQTAQIIDSLHGVFQSVDQQMGDFLFNIVTRAKTVKQAVSDMAVGILQSMAKIATNQLAGQLLTLGFKAIGSIGGASTGTPTNAVGGSDIAFPTTARQGGPVRARMGMMQRYVQGGSPGRDSVPTLTMPGEFITQKSAVDAVGVDFMNRLNTMGPRALDTKIPVPAANQNGGGVVNVWVVQPSQVPPPGPKDIVAHVADDLAKGGVTKKLVKQIAMGGGQ
jgi:TP901 family phage tail tape measure protein